MPCLNIMGDTMILCLCSVGDQQKWNFVEARSTIIPTVKSAKNHLVKVFEMFAFLEVKTSRKRWKFDY